MPTPNDGKASSTANHYARLAADYHDLWDRTPTFREWMVKRVVDVTETRPGNRIADIGGGTGIFSVELLRQLDGETTVHLVDPSAEMLAQAQPHPSIRPVCAAAENSVLALSAASAAEFDLVLVKEAVHHFVDIPSTLTQLSALVAPGGALLIVMLPTRIEYPLFDAALERFTSLQPDRRDIVNAPRQAWRFRGTHGGSMWRCRSSIG
ncbi:class I SAM-dependent methyltransferase [Mycobacterium sp. ITM-2016-00316]|uniref:class I SAM-dependent methyltransferase n=1 Tax=Mycobacterium sp. ITM-2016-00316 TaxID=2099695 RepID=UPI001304E4A2|nr:class I SAM-dependent methyltransferase [Mycobacterium sp. ITM-2016-00316]WNG81131.1 class I SAM-dependent methyltransferase [Mycobacterium sp. ITM-2016-00316]